jgi:DNA ligase-4
LDELATHSKFTQLSEAERDGPQRSQIAVLDDLYRTATPNEAALITQIILKDLRPIVSPLGKVHTTTNLLRKRPANPPLTVWQALKIWHPTLPALYRVYASIPEVFGVLGNGTDTRSEPVLGIPVQVNSHLQLARLSAKALQIPKCHKGRSCKDVITTLSTSKKIFCETKHDGER